MNTSSASENIWGVLDKIYRILSAAVKLIITAAWAACLFVGGSVTLGAIAVGMIFFFIVFFAEL